MDHTQIHRNNQGSPASISDNTCWIGYEPSPVEPEAEGAKGGLHYHNTLNARLFAEKGFLRQSPFIRECEFWNVLLLRPQSPSALFQQSPDESK
jgi:hypothetical protein